MNDSNILFSSYTAAMNAVKLLHADGIQSSVGRIQIPSEGCMYILKTDNLTRAENILKRNIIRFSYQDNKNINENEKKYN